jgi:hypothetical protein
LDYLQWISEEATSYNELNNLRLGHNHRYRAINIVFVQYNLQLRCNQLLKKIHDTDPIVLDDIDPTSEWVEESHPTEFDANFDIDDLGLGLDSDPIGVARISKAPSMANTSTSHIARPSRAFSSNITTNVIANVLEESKDPEDSEPEDDFVVIGIFRHLRVS